MNVKKWESFYIAGTAVKWYSHCGKQLDGFSKKINIQLLYDKTILLQAT
jgi:hypothetical protein